MTCWQFRSQRFAEERWPFHTESKNWCNFKNHKMTGNGQILKTTNIFPQKFLCINENIDYVEHKNNIFSVMTSLPWGTCSNHSDNWAIAMYLGLKCSFYRSKLFTRNCYAQLLCILYGQNFGLLNGVVFIAPAHERSPLSTGIVEIGPVIWKFNQIDAFSFQRWWNFKRRYVCCVNL